MAILEPSYNRDDSSSEAAESSMPMDRQERMIKDTTDQSDDVIDPPPPDEVNDDADEWDDWDGDVADDEGDETDHRDSAQSDNNSTVHSKRSIGELMREISAITVDLQSGVDPTLVERIKTTLVAVHETTPAMLRSLAQNIVDASSVRNGKPQWSREQLVQLGKGMEVALDTPPPSKSSPNKSSPPAPPDTKQAKVSVGATWSDAPEDQTDLPLPPNYVYDKKTGRIDATIVKKDAIIAKTITRQPTYVSGVSEDLNTGQREVVVSTRTPTGSWIDYHMPPAHFHDVKKVAEFANHRGSVVDPRLLGKYLEESYGMWCGLEKHPQYSTQQMGWCRDSQSGDMVYVFPERSIGVPHYVTLDLPSRTHSMLQSMFSVKGSGVTEQDHILRAINLWPKLAATVGAAASAALVRITKESEIADLFGYFFEIVSDQTGVGKSTALGMAFAPWGATNSVRLLWGTNYALQQYIQMLADAPSLFQESQADKTAGKGSNSLDPEMLLHAVGDGGGKLQGAKEGGLRPSPPLYSVVLLASNDHMLSPNANQGSKQRILSTKPPIPPGYRDEVESIMQALANHHGHGARDYIIGLHGLGRGHWDELRATIGRLYADEREWFMDAVNERLKPSSPLHSIAERRAKLFGLVALGFKLMMQHGYGQSAQSEVVQKGMQGIRDVFVDEILANDQADQDDNLEFKRYFEIIKDHMQRELYRIHGYERKDRVDGGNVAPTNGYIGSASVIAGQPHVCVTGTILTEWLKPYNKPLSTLLKAWVREKYVTPEKNGNAKRVVHYGNVGNGMQQKMRMVCFPADLIGLDEVDPAVALQSDDE